MAGFRKSPTRRLGGAKRPPILRSGDCFDGDERLIGSIRRLFADDCRLFYPDSAP